MLRHDGCDPQGVSRFALMHELFNEQFQSNNRNRTKIFYSVKRAYNPTVSPNQLFLSAHPNHIAARFTCNVSKSIAISFSAMPLNSNFNINYTFFFVAVYPPRPFPLAPSPSHLFTIPLLDYYAFFCSYSVGAR